MLPLPSFERIKKFDRNDLETAFIANWWVGDMLALRLADLAAGFARIDRAAAAKMIGELRAFADRDIAALRQENVKLAGPLKALEDRVKAALDYASKTVADAQQPGH